jgi:integrase
MPYNGDIVYCGMEDAVAAHPLHPLHPLALLPGPGGPGAPALAPVEYTLAVDRYLGQAVLGEASRRVYRISLSGWAWPLVGRTVPRGTARRGAVPPLVPLALLDDPTTPGRLAAALAERAAGTDARTANRELSALRSAVGWWLEQGWIRADPAAGLRLLQPAAATAPLRAAQVSDLLALPASLREHALWRLLYDSGAPAGEVLALDASQVDLSRHRALTRAGAGPGDGIEWQEATS